MSTPFEFLNSSIQIAPGRRVVPADDYQRLLSANEVLDEARKQADNIISEANEAYEARRLEGYQDGINQANDEKAAFCFQVSNEFSETVQAVQGKLSQLVPQIIKNLLGDIGSELSFKSYVSKALQELVSEEKLVLKVHPSKRLMLEEHIDELGLDQQGMIKLIQVSSDATLEPEQATIETGSSIVILDLNRQIELIEQYVEAKFKTGPKASLSDSSESEQSDITIRSSEIEEDVPFRVFD